MQHFLDTRAHDITYTLVATTSFREYYPGAEKAKPDEDQFQTNGESPCKLTVLSSVQPQAPAVAYVIPAFVWQTHMTRKTMCGRLAEPSSCAFISTVRGGCLGIRETLGVVLFDPASGVDPAKQIYASRWGADPAREITTPILRNELNEVNLCEQGSPIATCVLPEGGFGSNQTLRNSLLARA